MISLDNKAIINADMLSVIYDLKKYLYDSGQDYFRDIRENGENIQVSCPFHKQGQENKPSFGININNGKAHCFTCGWNGDLSLMISQLLGYNDNGKNGLKWLQRRYNSIEIESRTKIELPTREHKQDIVKEITEEELDSYRYVHPYMYKRGLTDEIIEKFDIGYNKENNCITFPVKDIQGRTIFVATRNVSYKFFGLPSSLNKPVYQGYRFVNGDYAEVYVTESFFNCLTCWKYDKPSVALMGTGTSYQYDILNKLPVRSYVLAFDPDSAGDRAVERFKRNVPNKLIYKLVYNEPDKDINDLQEQFLDLKKVIV